MYWEHCDRSMLPEMITMTCTRSFLIGACCLMHTRWFPSYHPQSYTFPLLWNKVEQIDWSCLPKSCLCQCFSLCPHGLVVNRPWGKKGPPPPHTHTGKWRKFLRECQNAKTGQLLALRVTLKQSNPSNWAVDGGQWWKTVIKFCHPSVL